MDNNYHGESFLNRLYKDLHMSDEVMHTALPSDTKDEKVSKYLSRLEKIEELAKNSKYNGLELLKELYYKKYVIKPENVPESYFELQKKIALERGYGHVKITKQGRTVMIDSIIDDQKQSLDTWLDYLMNDGSFYPEWFKYYAFQGMIKLGSYDKEKALFNKRTDSTTNVFVELNREALALVYDNLCYSLEGNKVDDELLQKLLDSGNFSKLYSYMLNKIGSATKDLNSNDGIWIKYNQGSDPLELVKSLEGKGTGWCTAGIETARSQLQGGDFYVYYTKDSNNEYKQPRIAIRMERSSIGEIRGIASNQNLEPEMEEVVEEKIQEFPDKDIYKKKVSDMKLLTEIYNNYKNRDLTREELKFLYEIDSKVISFGYQIDPRIKEILAERNFKKDLAKVFNCSEDEISNDKNDVLKGKKIVYFVGDLDLSELTTAEGLILPINVGGSLYLTKLESAEDLILPKKVGGNLNLRVLKNVKKIVFPDNVGKSLDISNLTTVEELILPNKVGGDLFLEKLISVTNLLLPKNVGGSVYLKSLDNIENLILPITVGGDLFLSSLKNVKGLVLPTTVGGDLFLSSLTSAIDLIFPEKVEGDLHLNSLKKIKNSKLPNKVGGSVNLYSLISIEDVVFPDEIGVDLNLTELVSAKDLIFPKKIGRNLTLSSLKYAENISLPNEVNLDVFLFELELAKNLILPNYIRRKLWLNNLISNDGLIVPVDFKYGSVISDYISIDDLKEKSLEINKKESKQKGFSKVGILILLNIIVSIGLIFLGVWFSL